MRGSGEEAPGKRSGTGGGSIQWVVVVGSRRKKPWVQPAHLAWAVDAKGLGKKH